MGRALRGEQFHHDEVCIVHAVQRCVRRAFLAGVDQATGKDYSVRREWIRRRFEALASAFGVDVLTYAIMSNHIHVILRNRPDVVSKWSDQEAAIRWLRVFPGRRLETQLAEPSDADVEMLVNNKAKLKEVRQRLADISWFMRALSEPIARRANRQDDCTGRFWEGRFKAQRIVDEAGLLACAMYVDLNPVKAAMAQSPEKALHTSAYDRHRATKGEKIDSAAFDLVTVSTEERAEEIKSLTADQRREKAKARHSNKSSSKRKRRVLRDSWLSPLTMKPHVLASEPEVSKSGVRASDKGFLNIAWREYFELLKWTAKQRTESTCSDVPKRLSNTLRSLGIEASMWRDLVWNFKKYFGRSRCAGSPAAMVSASEESGSHWVHGQGKARTCFVTE